MSSIAPHTPSPIPWREVFVIAGPTVATMTSYTIMTFVDKYLVSLLGPEPIYVGAQGNGGLVAWVAISIIQGTLVIINTYVSQHLGAGTPRQGPPYVWNGLWLALAYWAAILLPLSFLIPSILHLARIDPEQARLGGAYGQILLWGAPLTLATRVFSQFFFGMHRAGVVMVAGVVANVLNVVASYALMFGKFGLPALGMVGSALGTVLATAVELAIPAAVFLGDKFHKTYGTRFGWRPSWPHMRDIIRLGWPGGAMFGNEMICWSIFMVYLVSHFGRAHATAGWIAHQYMSLSFMPAVGLSVACTALVGKYQGMGRSDLAAQRAWMCIRAALAYMGLCGFVFVVFRHALVRLFVPADAEPIEAAHVLELGAQFLIATAAFQLFDAGAMTLSGALRGAGDTVVPGVLTVVAAWVVIVGGGFAAISFAPGLQSLGPWIAAAAYIFTLCIVLFLRFMHGRWKSIRVITPHPATPTV